MENVFGTLKRSYGYRRVRYMGLERNATELVLQVTWPTTCGVWTGCWSATGGEVCPSAVRASWSAPSARQDGAQKGCSWPLQVAQPFAKAMILLQQPSNEGYAKVSPLGEGSQAAPRDSSAALGIDTPGHPRGVPLHPTSRSPCPPSPRCALTRALDSSLRWNDEVDAGTAGRR